MVTSYSFFLAGNILLWPAVATLARLIGANRPGWGLCGGTLVIFGLFAGTFHAGVDHLAFQIVRAQNLELATKTVASSYGAFQIISTLTPLIRSDAIRPSAIERNIRPSGRPPSPNTAIVPIQELASME